MLSSGKPLVSSSLGPNVPTPRIIWTRPGVGIPDAAPSGYENDDGVGHFLKSTFIGFFEVSVSNLKLTTSGRPLREAGVVEMLKSIEEDGWVESCVPVVILRNASDEKLIDGSDARGMVFSVLDGNHRVAALARRDKNRGGGVDTVITVGVHRQISDHAQRIVAYGECVST